MGFAMGACAAQCALLAGALLVLAASPGLARHDAPDDCSWAADNSSKGVVSCRVRKLDGEATNLSALQPESTSRLHVHCSDVLLFESSVPPHFFQRLSLLEELTIDNCKILELPSGAFEGLAALKHLSVSTHNVEWGSGKSLELDSGSLDGLKELQVLDLVHNNIRALPDDAFCSLANLQTLNLSRNHLRDFDKLGFAPRRLREVLLGSGDCSGGAEVRALDLSFNHLPALGAASGLNRLRRLQHLHLQHNDIADVAGDAFKGLTALKVVNMSYNRLSTLNEGLFASSRELSEVYLQNNSLAELPRGLFHRLEQLVVLDLSRNLLTSAAVNESTFAGLIRLIVLNLAHNSLTHIDERTFKELYFLQILDLRNNSISHIADNAFMSLYNLHTLNLAENRLHSISAQLFNGLFVLSKLTLGNNMVANIDVLAFRNCSDLKDLDLSSNALQAVPDALHELSFLKTLDLGENQITTFKNGSFKGLSQLNGLRLIDNQIGNLTKGMFWDLDSLQVLNLAKNKIQSIERGTFDRNLQIEAIRLDGNYLVDINGVFLTLASLLWLNLSDNHLVWFDYAFVPPNLKWLDIHGNYIEKLGNYYELQEELHIKTLDASHNRIKEISPMAIPNSAELVFINNNLISKVAVSTFLGKTNLARVDMYSNELTKLDINAIRLSPWPANKTLPEFYLGGNPFFCDCSMEWLQMINNMTHMRQHPRVMDLDNVMCRMQNLRGRQHIAATEARGSNFLCTYETHCFALCHCCDFDACDCEMTCPQNCSCYHDQAWTTNVVDCSRQGSDQIPRRIPMDATEVYLDGNNLKELQNHVFIGRKNMRVLFVNSSRIESIQNRTFNGLNALEILHLEDNQLGELKGYEFEHLAHLRELYLQNNAIGHIGNTTFSSLRSLEILRLDGNHLHSFPVWQLSLNSYLVEVSLGNNHWSCRCKFLQELQVWVGDNAQKVIDATDIYCYVNDTKPPQKREVDLNNTACSDYYSGSSVIQSIMVSDYLPMMIVTLSTFLLLIVASLLIFIFRDPMRVWVYSKYGVRLFHFKAAAAGKLGGEDREKLYDGYVIYSPKDEEFVLQSIVAELEHGNPSFQLCLHYRDLPHQVHSYMQNTSPVVVEAAEASRRVILVLSRNFMETEWSRFEFRQAIHEALKGRIFKLVLVEDGSCIHEAEGDLDLRPYLKTGARVRWGEKRFWERLRYAMPSGDSHRKSNSNYRRNINTYSLESTGNNHHVVNHHVVNDHHGYTIEKAVKQPHPAMHINSHPLFLAAAANNHHHHHDNNLVPPAYTSGNTLTRTSGRHQRPAAPLGGAADCEDANYSSAATATPSPRPLNRHQNGSVHRESPSPNTRPTSEHIYSSIDSDYPTFERAGSRRQANGGPASAAPVGGVPLPGVHRPPWRTAGASVVENGGVQAYLV
ncbi:toll-like receptor 7 [Frankliniella occidentalis]|uniref:Toll-like receptor 7 n=1 Tax=Frankliniella occidentalis TaxID=133901 RepID=A0A6J1S9J3_FRAOC|nr:toll-like receptor 7 [Frankliniella occidentalis]